MGIIKLANRVERVQALAEAGIIEIPSAYVRPLDERPTISQCSDMVPVVDLSGADKERIRANVGKACRNWGFFQVINHGVDEKVMHAMRNDGRFFFALPIESKLKYSCKEGIASEGYGSKMLVNDDQILDWRDYVDLHTLPLSRREPSNWPEIPPSFRETVVQYSEEMKLLAQRILTIISEALGLPSNYIEDAIGLPYQNISLNYYPPCPQPELTLGLQAHSDLGALTILMQADVAGLQVLKNGEWLAVQPLPGALVVNLGDQMEILSNGYFKSVEHRAVVNSQSDRFSIATFYDPSKECRIFPAPALVGENDKYVYKGVLFADHVSSWYSKGPDGKRPVESLMVPR